MGLHHPIILWFSGAEEIFKKYVAFWKIILFL